jgi:branched-chain amino acid transport system permease protein
MKQSNSYLILAIALVVIVGLSFLVGGMNFYYQKIILNIGIFMILATSLNLINGFTGQFSLGHAGFMAVGAYTSVVVTTMLLPKLFGEIDGGAMGDIALFLGMIGGGIVAAIAGLLVGIPSLRLKGDYLAIVTLGFGEIIRVLLQNVDFLGRSTGLSNIPIFTTFIWVFGTVAVLVFIIQNLINSTYGKGFLAVRDDEIAAEAMGVNTTRYKVIAFVIGAFFAGVAGGLYAHYSNAIAPADFAFLKSVEIIVMVILGGMGSTYGVLFAAALLTFLPEYLRSVEVFGLRFGEFRMSIYSLMLIILMLTRPQGLFGDFNLLRWVSRLRNRQQKVAPTLEG